MIMNNKGKRVKILWSDTKVFSPKNMDVKLSIMETTGFFETEFDDYFLIKNPITLKIKTGKKHPEQNPSFYLIPKNMVKNIQYE
jgi:hypothetical protein